MELDRTELWQWLTQDKKKTKQSQSMDYASASVRGRRKSSIFCVAVVACLIWSQAPVAAVTGKAQSGACDLVIFYHLEASPS